MKSAAPSRRDRLRQMLADLRMPGALEALDAILHGVDGATLTAPEAIEQAARRADPAAQQPASGGRDALQPPAGHQTADGV
jgi:hypothetical protein